MKRTQTTLLPVLVAIAALVGCGQSESKKLPAPPAGGQAPAPKAAAAPAGPVNFAKVTEWSAELRQQFLTQFQSVYRETQTAGELYLGRLGELSEETRPAARAALEAFYQRAQELRAELFRASEVGPAGTSAEFSAARDKVLEVRARLFEAFEALKSHFP